MSVARQARRHERGHAVVIVALGAVTLMAITGLAVDGGMAMGAYRHAQNAADAGALAAARQVYINAMTSPHAVSNSTTLTPVAQAEVQRNHATLGTVSGGTALRTDTLDSPDGISRSFAFAAAQMGSVLTGSETVYVPNVGQGLTADGALADVQTTSGPLLQPINAQLELLGAHATTMMNLAPPSGSGSEATAKVDLAIGSAPGLGQSGSITCYTADAKYKSGKDTTGPQQPCADSGGLLPAGVSASGTVATSPNPDARVGQDNHPSAWPRMIAGPVGGNAGKVTAGASLAATGARLNWDAGGTLTSSSSVIASNAQSVLPGLTIDAAQVQMTTSVSVDSKGNTKATLSCIPTTVNLSGTMAGGVQQVLVDSSCKPSPPGPNGVTFGLAQPPPGSACSTAPGTGVVTCSISSCFLQVVQPGAPYATTLCLGENRVSLSATPVNLTTTTSSSTSSTTTSTSSSTTTSTSTSATTSSSSTTTSTTTSAGLPPNLWVTQFTGAVTVTAQVDQPTYFLSILGWTHTTPAATATADVESVVDESAAAFAADPFGMPDAAWSLEAPSRYEHLTVGHSYYLYGAQMQANSPAPVMPQTWQGQLAPTSAHHAGNTLTGVSTLTTTPHPYVSNGGYCLVPVFNPMDGTVEEYGVFVATANHPSWYTLVNSVPVQGYIVQATSLPGWITFEEGAVSIKLVQ